MRNTNGRKRALASTAAVLGLAGSGTVAGDTFGRQGGQRTRGQQTQPQTGLQALVFVNDYQPGVSFRMVSQIQQPTVNQILGYVDPGNPQSGDGAVVDPTDWNGYIINYRGCGPGNYNLAFLREGTLRQGQTYSFTTDAVFFSHQLQLLESEIRTGGGTTTEGSEGAGEAEDAQGTEEGAEGPADAETETTPEQTTTTTETTTTTTEQPTPTTETTTTTTEDTTTTPQDETTTAEVVVNATETEDGE